MRKAREKESMKKRLLFVTALLGVVVAMTAGSAVAAPTSHAVYLLNFGSATDTFTFDLAKLADNPAGTLTVATGDCCIHPDFWETTIDTALPANPANDVSAVGDGQGGLSGEVSVKPFIAGSVTISYNHGTDVFAASMCVDFTYSKSPGVEITAPPGASDITGDPFFIDLACGN